MAQERTVLPSTSPSFLAPTDTFVRRHVAPSEPDVRSMLATIGCASLDELISGVAYAASQLL